ncbi:MAG: hypothetical protein H6Q51_1978, partial [Deltaproteobacteria bacterium]|nr:hypothetical protein [Deltaproteobacteria bacterium]
MAAIVEIVEVSKSYRRGSYLLP